MKTVRLGVVIGAIVCVVAGCGGSSPPPAGQSQAAAACAGSGTQAASDASQAASLNARYATLSADEAALASSESTEDNELSDGNSTDDSGLGALAGANSLGSSAGIKVISDCVSLGLSVTHH